MIMDTKTALMDCAERAVRRRGFDGFSYADLAEAVGIRKASIHYHFPTKAGLSEALMDRYQAMLEETFVQIDCDLETGAKRMAAVLDFYRNALNQGQTLCLCVALIGSRESLSDALDAKIIVFRKMVTAWLARCFALGREDCSIANVVNPDLEARATLALLEGAQMAARAAEDVNEFDQATALLRSRLTLATSQN